jgi:hypothetical protein
MELVDIKVYINQQATMPTAKGEGNNNSNDQSF